MNKDELYHYGVLGMKWGVHRAKVNARKAAEYRQKADKSTTLSVIAKQNKYGTEDEWAEQARRQNAKADKYAAKSHYEYKSWGTKHNEKLAKKWADKFHEISDRPTERPKSGPSKGHSVFVDPKDGPRQIRALTKAQKYNRRYMRSKELDRRELEYATRVKTGGNIASRLLTGYQGLYGVGSKPYQQYVAMMGAQGKGKNGLKLGAYAASRIFGRIGSTAVKALYLRSGEHDAVEYLKENVPLYGESTSKKKKG